jgi:hypothetical protein
VQPDDELPELPELPPVLELPLLPELPLPIVLEPPLLPEPATMFGVIVVGVGPLLPELPELPEQLVVTLSSRVASAPRPKPEASCGSTVTMRTKLAAAMTARRVCRFHRFIVPPIRHREFVSSAQPSSDGSAVPGFVRRAGIRAACRFTASPDTGHTG